VATTSDTKQQRSAFWRNTTLIKWVLQLVFLFAIVFLFWVIIRQVSENLRAVGLDFSFDFLDEPVGFQISEGIFIEPRTGWDAMFTGMVNMLRIAASGIIAATLLGVLIGVSRLSNNALARGVATGYIETIRNIPLLVQIIFWLALVQLTFPDLGSGAATIDGWFYLSKRGISFAWLFPSDAFWQWLTLVLIGGVVAFFVYRWRFKRQEATGEDSHPIRWAVGAFLAIAAVAWFVSPLAGVFSWLFGFLSSFFGNLPTWVMQGFLALVCLALAAFYIKRYLDALRTPAGLGKLTDDDYFKLFSAGLLGVLGAGFFIVVPGFSETILTWTSEWFAFVEGRFDFNTGAPIRGSRPGLVQRGLFVNYGDTGLTMSPAFFAVWIGVVLYTASFIGEIVRGGILAVPKGQSEAGSALGLKRSQLLRLVVLPQAFRIILPPLGNQYLNLAKNTSLGVAVAFAEVVAVGQTVFNQTGASIQVILIWMGFYLMVSLTISAIVNYFNRRMQLVER
jgi:general L-amino acid transport system permease protein